MNVIFSLVLLASGIYLLITNPDSLLSSLIEGGKSGLNLSIKLFAIYAVWTAILTIWKKTGLQSALGKRLSPVLKRLFPKEEKEVYDDLAVNLSANMLGMGSAGTPAGISATEKMSKKNKIMLIVINSSSVQIIPTTIIAMRSEVGAVSDIILPSVIATFLSTALGILLVKFFVK